MGGVSGDPSLNFTPSRKRNRQRGQNRFVLVQPDEAIENKLIDALGRGGLRRSRRPLARIRCGNAFADLHAQGSAGLRPRRCRRIRE